MCAQVHLQRHYLQLWTIALQTHVKTRPYAEAVQMATLVSVCQVSRVQTAR